MPSRPRNRRPSSRRGTQMARPDAGIGDRHPTVAGGGGVSRILGARDFYGRSFAISPATLDPRPDSETLIAAVLELVRSEGRTSAPLRLLDVGTGSGGPPAPLP